jgi:hypothetical protein
MLKKSGISNAKGLILHLLLHKWRRSGTLEYIQTIYPSISTLE